MDPMKLVCAAIIVTDVGSGALAQSHPLALRTVCGQAVAEHAGARCPILSQAGSQVIEGARSAVSHQNAQWQSALRSWQLIWRDQHDDLADVRLNKGCQRDHGGKAESGENGNKEKKPDQGGQRDLCRLFTVLLHRSFQSKWHQIGRCLIDVRLSSKLPRSIEQTLRAP
jgi:hypothetical protein